MKFERRPRAPEKVVLPTISPLASIVLAGVFSIVFVVSTYSTTLATYSADLPIQSSVLRQSLYLSCAAAIMLLHVTKLVNVFSLLPRAFIPAAAWFLLSVLWSSQPLISASRLSVVFISSVACFVSVTLLGRERTIGLLSRLLLAVLLTNLLTVVLFPSLGVMFYERVNATHQWRGLFAEKNEAGAIAALSALLFMFGSPFKSKLLNYACLFLSAILLLSSLSRTALIMFFVSSVIGWLFYARGSADSVGRVVSAKAAALIASVPTLIAVAALLLATISGDALLGLVSDPETFTNRGYIWHPLVASYLENPVLGTGFGAYWTDAALQPGQVSGDWLQKVGQGHNGYLDLLVQVGLPGLAFIILGTVTWPLYHVLRLQPRPLVQLGLPISLIVFCLGSNLTESGLFTRDVAWNTFLLIGLSLLALSGRAQPITKQRTRKS